MTNQLKTLGIAALLAQSLVFFACSSSSPATGSGGSTGSGGDATAGASGTTGAGGGPVMMGLCAQNLGTCPADDCTKVNPDTATGGACTDGCESSSCTTPCSQACCVPCGIDAAGIKTCTCMTPGLAFNNCTCSPPTGFPTGLTGGTCMPQGYAATMVPATAPAGSISLKGVPCTVANAVCFTAESTASSGRGCICQGGIMHCGSVNKWFTQIPGTTAY
jgi:hypothetical protein